MPKLLEYRAKRNFRRTTEPLGIDAKQPTEHLRFVIQKHEARKLHYDLRLELDGVLKSWAVTRGPSLDPNVRRLAVAVEDHPLDYGDFEGTIPRGEYGGGTVMIWDRGFWQPSVAEFPGQQIESGELKFAIAGSKLRGNFVLVRMKPDAKPQRHDNWLLIKHRDRYAKPHDADRILKQDVSVASGRSMAAIAAGKGPKPTAFFSGRRHTLPKTSANRWATRARKPARQTIAKDWIEAMPQISTTSMHVAGVRISNPAKLLWPESAEPPVSKFALANYLMAVGDWLIEHIRGRPCSVLRVPDGIDGQQFFQRHATNSMPGQLARVRIAGDREPYLQIDDVTSLIAMAQLAAVEFHPWGSQPGQPHVPGRLVFDLDPGDDVPFRAVIDAAQELRSRLQEVGLKPYCKTTGGKGLHVVTPLAPEEPPPTWEQAKLFARTVCAQAAADSPSRYLIKMTKRLRSGRIFLDYLRNDMKATSVAPLSPRARPGATVSMPLDWEDVAYGLDPKTYTIWTAAQHMTENKPWRRYSRDGKPLTAAIRSLTAARS